MSSSSSATVVVVVHRPTPTTMLYPSINNSVGGISLMRNNNNNNNRLRLSSKRQQSERKIRGYYNWTVVACSGSNSSSELDCVGTGLDVECIVVEEEETRRRRPKLVEEEEEEEEEEEVEDVDVLRLLWDWGLLLSPFFFWGTSMVAMKEVLPKAGPFFVSSFRLIPAGILLIAFASYKGRRLPSGFMAWFSISLFALVDSTCFQGFLAQGLQTTSAGLGSLIIDSQPLTVALLASFFYGESIGPLRASGLLLGLIGLLLLQLPPALDLSFQAPPSLWGTGEWWMLLAAQSMALGTLMVRWVSKYSDPVMATGWHMLIGALPFLFISLLDHNNNHTNPALALPAHLNSNDFFALLYTSIFGSAISYGVFFYNATKGSLTKLSSLTFLTPMFASIFGFIYLGETYSPVQVVGAMVTVLAIYMVNCGKGDGE